MRYGVLLLVSVLLGGVAVSCQLKQTSAFRLFGGTGGGGDSGDDEPLLLLDDDEEGANAGPMANNDRCFVCHLNYQQEDIAVVHARADMGCVACHGESDEHMADESWAEGGNGTAPEKMYPRDTINPACMECHTKEKIDTEEHEAFFAATTAQMVCTDCHGKHRLETRKLKWK